MAYRELSSYSQIAGTSEPGYVLNATHQDWEDFIRDAEANLDLANSYDFETSFTYASTDESDYDHAQRELTQVQASLRPGQAIVSGWAPELLPFYKRLMEIPNPKLDYNGRGFDRAYNRALGIKPAGTYIDLIDAWHHWQPDLPRGLQYACSFVLPFEGPWKHLFPIHPRLYGAFDVDYPQRLWQYLQKHLGELRHPETGVSLLDGYWRQVNKLCAVSLDRMQARGIPVDNDKRREIWDTLAEMAKEVQAQIQDLIPEHLKPAKQKQGLKQIPMFIRKDPRLLEEAETSGRVWNPAIEAWYVKRNFRLEDGSEERRWCQIEPWNPNSTFQVRDYIRWRRENEISDILAARKYCRHFTGRSPLACPECRQSVETRAVWKVPTEFRSDKETTDKKELRRLQIKTRDVVLEKVVELREITKMAGTYVGSPDGKQKGWAPAEDGRAHPFFTTAPATGQLSSREPNCFSDDTEVLTDAGWKLFKDLTPTMRVAQYATSTGEITFARPRGYVTYWYSGPMTHITTDKQLDLLMTPEHRCLLYHRKTGKQTWVNAEIYPTDYKQIQAGSYSGGNTELSNSEIIFLAALQADGHLHKNCSAISFGLTKPRKKQRLEQALRDLEYSYSRYEKDNGSTIYYIHAGEVPEWIRARKTFGPWILELSKSSFSALAEEIWFWDGCYERRSMYSSSVRENTDWAQILTLLSNRRARVREYWNDKLTGPNWQVDATNENYSLTSTRRLTSEYYCGYVYCVTMPQGTVIVRRNGRVAITGNCQNFPKHNPKFGKLMRGLIKAPIGYRLIEADFKAFHVLTTGFEAKDPLYMRLARLDMHSFFAATGLLGLYRQDELLRHSDADLMKLFKELKADKTPKYRVAAAPDPVDFKFVRDKQAKPTILGYGFGMGAARLYHENQEFMAGIPDAARIIGRLDTGFPVTCAWRDEIQSIAHKQGYLISRHGYIRWFNSVFRYRPLHPSDSIKAGWKIVTTPDGLRWRIENGDDAEAAIAFLPANDAFGHIKEAMIRLEEAGYGEEFGLVNQIHDSLMLVCPSEKIDRCMEIVKFEMEKPSEYLILPDGSGLSCQAEISVSPIGGSWAECEEVQI